MAYPEPISPIRQYVEKVIDGHFVTAFGTAVAPQTYTPAYSAIGFAQPIAVLEARYVKLGKWVQGAIVALPTALSPVNSPSFSLPSTPHPMYRAHAPMGEAHYVDVSTSKRYVGKAVFGGGGLTLRYLAGSPLEILSVTSTLPFGWATVAPLDQILITFGYLEA